MQITPSTRLDELPSGKHPAGFDLFLLVGARSRSWVWRNRYAGKERPLTLGQWPALSFDAAMAAVGRCIEWRAAGLDPVEAYRSQAQATAAAEAVRIREEEQRVRQVAARFRTFKEVRDEWWEGYQLQLSESTRDGYGKRFAKLAPLDKLPLLSIDKPTVLGVLKLIEKAGHHETNKRVRQIIERVFDYAIVAGYLPGNHANPAVGLSRFITPAGKMAQHHPAITSATRASELARAIGAYGGSLTTVALMRLSMYLFQRPGELRDMEWTELELDGQEPQWKLPRSKMKQRRAHVVPLSSYAVGILRDLEPLTGDGRYVFPCHGNPAGTVSENTVNSALKRMGFAGEHTGHGFRATAATILNELGWNAKAVDRQLSHQEESDSSRPYNRAEYLGERRVLMAAWGRVVNAWERNDPRALEYGAPPPFHASTTPSGLYLQQLA